MKGLSQENKKYRKNLADQAFDLFVYTMAVSCICMSIFFIVLSIILLRS